MVEKEIMFLSIHFIKIFGILYYAKKLYMEFFYHNHNIFVFNPFLAFVLKTYYKDIKFLSSQNIIEQYRTKNCLSILEFCCKSVDRKLNRPRFNNGWN